MSCSENASGQRWAFRCVEIFPLLLPLGFDGTSLHASIGCARAPLLRGPRSTKDTQVRSSGLVGQAGENSSAKAGLFSPLRRVFDGVSGAIICPGIAYVHSVTSKRNRSLHCALETDDTGDV